MTKKQRILRNFRESRMNENRILENPNFGEVCEMKSFRKK